MCCYHGYRHGFFWRIEAGWNSSQPHKTARTGAPFFWDSLPTEVLEDVLDRVLTSLSRAPTARNWESHVPLRSIIDIFGVGGCFGRVLNTRFHTLCISATADCSVENEEYGWNLRPLGPMI